MVRLATKLSCEEYALYFGDQYYNFFHTCTPILCVNLNEQLPWVLMCTFEPVFLCFVREILHIWLRASARNAQNDVCDQLEGGQNIGRKKFFSPKLCERVFWSWYNDLQHGNANKKAQSSVSGLFMWFSGWYLRCGSVRVVTSQGSFLSIGVS